MADSMTEETVWRSSGAYDVEERATHYVVEYFTDGMAWLAHWAASGAYYALDEAIAVATRLEGEHIIVGGWDEEHIIATRVRKITP